MERRTCFYATVLVDGNLAAEIGQKVCFDLDLNQEKLDTIVATKVQLYDVDKSEVEERQYDDGRMGCGHGDRSAE